MFDISHLVNRETPDSLASKTSEAWEPEWMVSTFAMWLKCSNKACGQDVAVTGNGTVEQVIDPDRGPEYHWHYWPKAVVPMPDIILLPDNCPEKVCQELRAAFALYYVDASAAASRVGTSIERLLDFFRIPKRKRTARGQFITPAMK